MTPKKTQIDELGGVPSTMKANSVEEELEHLAKLVDEAEELGIDPWPERKPPKPWAKSEGDNFGQWLANPASDMFNTLKHVGLCSANSLIWFGS